MSRWFRAYDDALDDPKVQTLSDALFRAWFNLMCVSSKRDGQPFGVAEVAFRLRVTPAKASAVVAALVKAGLLDEVDGRYVSHNWASRQFKSDVSNERVKRHRERSRNVTVTPNETPPETEQNRTEQKEASARSRPPRRATGLPGDFVADSKAVSDANLTDAEGRREFEKFKNYCLAHGKTYKDWQAAWRNWCSKAAEFLGREAPRAPIEGPLPDGKFYAKFGSKQLEEWDGYKRRTTGKGLPRGKDGGWLCDAEWPPGYDPAENNAPASPAINLRGMQ